MAPWLGLLIGFGLVLACSETREQASAEAQSSSRAPAVLAATQTALEAQPSAWERSRSNAIETELAAARAAAPRAGPDDSWAGTYCMGDGFDANRTLELLPDGRFLFRWHGCTGDTDRNLGRACVEDGRLRLTFEYPNERDYSQGCADEFVMVAWGERHYLVPADELAFFCSLVNSAAEPRTGILGRVFLREGEWGRPATGRPLLPDICLSWLLARPLETSVIEVVETRTEVEDSIRMRRSRLVLGAGARQGVFAGMLVYAGPRYETLGVRAVHEDTCEALQDEYEETSSVPEVGWLCSTFPPWRAR